MLSDMTTRTNCRTAASTLALVLACITGLGAADTSLALIPWPEQLERHDGAFRLDAKTRVLTTGHDHAVAEVAEQLAARLRTPTGYALPVSAGDNGDDAIVINGDGDAATLGDEGYRLEVAPNGVRIVAAAAAGAFHGVQTLLQLLPVQAFSRVLEAGVAWQAPALSISDRPRMRWRGMLLDTGRHFFGRDAVLGLLDEMALLKYNVLQLHLTEDQGWRLQIRRFPELTTIGATRASSPASGDPSRPQDVPYGPYFYTQDDIRAIVAHAAQLHIMVVPEIEMPGHCLAALTCHPELSCTGGPFAVRTAWGVERDVYCAGNDATFTFLQQVLDEVVELFPSPYIHIGGDECPKDRWKACPKCQARIKAEGLADEHDLQSWFIRRVAAYLATKGKRIIGWDEILEGAPIPGATVTVWRNAKSGTVAAQRGAEVIMCPGTHCYFDHPQAREDEPPSHGPVLPVETVFAFDPMPPGLPPELAAKVIGIEGTLWSEYIPSFRHLEYMAWPRGAALAEVGWSPAARAPWDDFRERLAQHLRRLDLLGVNYRALREAQSSSVVWRWTPKEVAETAKTVSVDVGAVPAAAGPLRFAFRFTGGKCRLDVGWAALLIDGKEVSRDAHAGSAGAHNLNNLYTLSLPEHPAGAKVTLQVELRSDGGTDSSGEVVMTR